MYIYFGRTGSGYRWALVYISDGMPIAYVYERGPETKWRTKYVGRVRLPALMRIFDLARVGLYDFVVRKRRAGARRDSLREELEVADVLGIREDVESLLGGDDDG